MPGVNTFFGIVVAFYWEDHPPPHFHAKYGGDGDPKCGYSAETLCTPSREQT